MPYNEGMRLAKEITLVLIITIFASLTNIEETASKQQPEKNVNEPVDSISTNSTYGEITGVALADVGSFEPMEISIWRYPDSLQNMPDDSTLSLTVPYAKTVSDSLPPRAFSIRKVSAGHYRIKMVPESKLIRVRLKTAFIDKVEVVPDSISVVVGELSTVNTFEFRRDPLPDKRDWIRWVIGKKDIDWKDHILDSLNAQFKKKK